jgi:hypothetical protein
VSAAVDALAGKGVTGIALRARITDAMGHGNTKRPTTGSSGNDLNGSSGANGMSGRKG